MGGPIRAALVSDQPLLAAGLNAVFEKSGACRLVAVYTTATELYNLLPSLAPDLAIIDAGADFSFQSLGDVIQAVPTCRFVVLARTATAELIYHAQEVGVAALLPTTLPAARLLSCLARVHHGESILDFNLPKDNEPARTIHLTRRESQLVELVSRGLKNKEIATCLEISEGTVKVYLSKLFQKVGANDRLELALFGLKNIGSQFNMAPAGMAREATSARPRSAIRGPRTLFLRSDPLRVALR